MRCCLRMVCFGVLAIATATQSHGAVIAWYNFADSSNAAALPDASGHGHTGAVGGATYVTPNAGKPAFVTGAMNFNGGGDHADINITGTSNPFSQMTANNAGTVGLWIYGAANQPIENVAFDAYSVTQREFQTHLPWVDGNVYFDTGGCCTLDQRLSGSAGAASNFKGQWNQWTFVKNGADKAIYLNGSPYLTQTGTATSPIGTLAGFVLGNDPGFGTGYYGQIADFVVFDQGLNQAQVTQLVQQGAQSFVPEPSSLALASFAALGLLAVARRQRRAA